jgi:hypothetical protein
MMMTGGRRCNSNLVQRQLFMIGRVSLDGDVNGDAKNEVLTMRRSRCAIKRYGSIDVLWRQCNKNRDCIGERVAVIGPETGTFAGHFF